METDWITSLLTGAPLTPAAINTAANAQAPVVTDNSTGTSQPSSFWNFLTGALNTAGTVYTASNQTDAQKAAAAGTAALAAQTAATQAQAASTSKLLLIGLAVVAGVVALVFIFRRK